MVVNEALRMVLAADRDRARVAESPQSLALRGKIIQVHEFENGTVKLAPPPGPSDDCDGRAPGAS
jgi:hypothetical protein